MVHKRRSLRKKRVKRKPRTLLSMILVASALTILYTSFVLLFSDVTDRVEILYFRNDGCPIVENTDSMIGQAITEFGEKLDVKIINAQLYPDEPEDTEEIKRLREEFQVIGLPDIIINGKKFTKKFTAENLFEEIGNYI